MKKHKGIKILQIKYFMQATILAAMTISTLVPNLANANCCYDDYFDCICPYGGLEAKWQSLAGRSHWSRVLNRSAWGGSIFVGSRFMEFLGLEFGYTDLFTKTRKHTFAAGEDFFRNGNTDRAETHITTRFSSGYVDLNGYYPCFNDCFDFIGSLGVAAMEPRVNITIPNLGTDETGFNTDDGARLERIKGASKAIFRLGAGAQYMFCDCVGLRGMVRYENTSALRFRVPGERFTAPFNTDALRRPFKDSISVALGVFAAF